jgi:hypothetical protein
MCRPGSRAASPGDRAQASKIERTVGLLFGGGFFQAGRDSEGRRSTQNYENAEERRWRHNFLYVSFSVRVCVIIHLRSSVSFRGPSPQQAGGDCSRRRRRVPRNTGVAPSMREPCLRGRRGRSRMIVAGVFSFWQNAPPPLRRAVAGLAGRSDGPVPGV